MFDDQILFRDQYHCQQQIITPLSLLLILNFSCNSASFVFETKNSETKIFFRRPNLPRPGLFSRPTFLKPRLFSRRNFPKPRLFSETEFSETESLKKSKSLETEMFQNREVSKPKCRSLPVVSYICVYSINIVFLKKNFYIICTNKMFGLS